MCVCGGLFTLTDFSQNALKQKKKNNPNLHHWKKNIQHSTLFLVIIKLKRVKVKLTLQVSVRMIYSGSPVGTSRFGAPVARGGRGWGGQRCSPAVLQAAGWSPGWVRKGVWWEAFAKFQCANSLTVATPAEQNVWNKKRKMKRRNTR